MGGHPSDVLTPILAVAEASGSSGRELITAVVLGYELYLRISDAVKVPSFDCVNFACIGTAAAGARLMGLGQQAVADAIAMAAVSGNVLAQVRNGHLSVWKAVAAGQAGRTGVSCAVMAAAGMQGPHLPFMGKHGWCNHVSGPLQLAPMGGRDASFKISDTLIKQRSSCATTISSILAAEKASAPVRDRLEQVKAVTVEVYDTAKRNLGTEAHHWDPRSRETADHSIPYVVAATLIDGTITPLQFNEAHLWSPQLRALLPKIAVAENPEFTRIYHRVPVEHPARVTVEMKDGQRIVGESGGRNGDLSNPKSDAEIEAKFRGMAEDFIGKQRCDALLDQLWNLEKVGNVARIPPAFLFA
jgi:2-methylcitrate dehydratase